MRHIVVGLVGLVLVGCGEVHDLPPIDSCTPNEFVRCNEDVAQICNAAGDGADDTACGDAGCNEDAGRCNACVPDAAACGPGGAVDRCDPDGLPLPSATCAAGCVDAPAAHCAYLQPSYAALVDACDEPAAMPALDITTSQTLDSNSDLTCTGGVLPQAGGPAICVVRFGAITVSANRTLTFTGQRAIALVADRAITVNGTLDVSASGSTNGPGGGTTRSGGASNAAIGGGGAGFRTAGGSGGSDTGNGGAGNGGATGTNPADLVAFIGGPRPQFGALLQASPGGGGGALALIACRGAVTISATGLVDAGGGGGGGGADQIAGPQIQVVSAAGGGAGGNVVLQGLEVTVAGQLYANGGGGGGGTSSNDPVVGAAGENGRRSVTAAPGGDGAGTGGAGGSGGGAAAAGQNGLMPGTASGTPGGGGGSAGFLQTYTPTGVPPTLAPSAVSPPFSPNRTVQTR